MYNNRSKVIDIHNKAIIIDAMTNAAFSKEYFQLLLNAGYTATNVTLALPWYGENRLLEALRDVYEWYHMFNQWNDLIIHCTKAEHITNAKERKVLALILGFQDLGPVEPDLKLLTIFHKLGVRIAGLTYNKRNAFADGCMERSDAGLSELGFEAIDEMNRLGIVIDLTHSSEKTALDVLEYSRDPVIFSHSNVYSLCDNPRNVKDDVLKALAEKDGVIGVCAHQAFLTRAKIKPTRTINDLLDHIEYIVNLIGSDHVGLGLDFYRFNLEDAIKRGATKGFLERLEKYSAAHAESPRDPKTYENIYAEGIENASKIINITKGLIERGFSEDEIRKILGGNFLRVFRRVWRN